MKIPKLQSIHGLRLPVNRHRTLPLITLSLAAAALFPAISSAQEESEEEIFELSPFIVQEDDVGWTATQTLAGSRMRTSLDNVATQVEIVTMDFMDDYGLNSIEDAAIYTMNAENQQEYASSGAGKVGNAGDIRIRGLSNATRSRNFFRTQLRLDNYNLDRVTISSGPNSILFGTGSPAGALDVTLSRPLLNKNLFKVRLQADSWDGLRGEFHANVVLAEDKLAVRVDVMSENRGFYVEPSVEKSRRLHAAVLYSPWKSGQFSFHFERAQIETRRPARNTPYDEASLWYRSGDLGSVYGNQSIFPNDSEFRESDNNGRNDLIQDDQVFGLSGNNVVVVAGYDPAGVNAFGSDGMVDVERLDNYDLADGTPLIDPVNSDIDGLTIQDPSIYPRDVNTMYNMDWQKDYATIYNFFYNQEIINNLFLEVALQREEYENNNANLMGFRSSVTVHVDPNEYLGSGEPNPYAGQVYLQGSPEAGGGENTSDEGRIALSYEFDFRDHFDNRIIRWLGRHRLAGLLSTWRQEQINQEYWHYIAPKVDGNGYMRDPYFAGYDYTATDSLGRPALSALGADFNSSDGARRPSMRIYIPQDGGSLVPQIGSYDPSQPLEIMDSNGEMWIADPFHAATGTNGETLITGRNTNGTKSQFDTAQIAYEGYFFNDRIVLTYGWRNDKLKSAKEQAPEVMWQNPETGEIVPAGDANYQPHRSLYGYQDWEPSSSGDTEYKGIVVHPFRNWGWRLPLGADVSFSYSESDTFQPNRTDLDPDGNFRKGEVGDGKDYGVRLSLADGKFNIRYNHYKVTAGPTNLNLPFRRFRFALRPVMRDILQGLVANEAEWRAKFPVWPLEDAPGAVLDRIYPFESGGGWETGNFFNYGDPYAMSANTEAGGDEILVSWAPTPNWNFRFTWNQQEVIQSDIATQWIEFAEAMYDIMENTTFTEGYIPNNPDGGYDDPNGTDMDGNGIIEQFKWDAIPTGNGNGRNNPNTLDNFAWGQNDDFVEGGWTRNTMKEQFMQGVYNGNAAIPVMLAYDGRPNEFVRQNRWNFNVMYRFTEGSLDGLRIGGGYRWREAPALGFGVQDVNGVLVPDTSVILTGEEEKYFDLSIGYRGRASWLGNRRYDISLNVRNVLDEGKYVPKHIDFYTGETLSEVRVDGRLFVVTFDIEL